MSTRLKDTPARLMVKVITALQGCKQDKLYDVEIKEHRSKRSLDANAYYWVLLGKYASWAREDKIRMHNALLARYGKDFTLDDGQMVFVVLPDNEKYLDMQTFHVRPTSRTETRKEFKWNPLKVRYEEVEKVYRTFILLKGSHEMNTKEMADLIEGLINDIKGSEAPIETLTPNELQELKAAYDQTVRQKETRSSGEK